MEKNRYFAVLQTLADHGVAFIVVGGVSAVLRGAPINTFDLDVVHFTEPENVDRLLAALTELEAFYRFQPERRMKPDASHLGSPGHQLLMTKFGPLDLLGAIGKARSYRDLLPDAGEMDLGEGVSVRVLGLETQIAVKEEIGGEKDLAALPILRHTLEESRRRS
jgi:predicted nucleotidyltransferase